MNNSNQRIWLSQPSFSAYLKTTRGAMRPQANDNAINGAVATTTLISG